MPMRDLATTIPVQRAPLIARLDGALTRSVTLVVASAGSGKTVLLSQWIQAREDLKFISINVGADDNEPAHFTRHLLTELSKIYSGFDGLRNIISGNKKGIGLPLVEAIGKHLVTVGRCVLIFDDFHLLSNQTIEGELARLVEVMPQSAHVVISSRSELPSTWNRHRFDGTVAEIRQADLAFDTVDATTLLCRATGKQLTSDQVAALVDKTEGWAAGLQLAGINIRLRKDPDSFIAQFSGSNRLVSEYLCERVLDILPEQNRSTLLRLSALDRLNTDLIYAVTGDPNAQILLEELINISLFIVVVDEDRNEYRFHHLFRELLRYQLRASDPDAEVNIAVAAASWYEKRGDFDGAIEHLLRAREWDRALSMIMARAGYFFELGNLAKVIEWILAVPSSIRAGRRELGLLLGILEGLTGDSAKADDSLGAVVLNPSATPGERALGYTYLSALAHTRSRPEVALDAANKALELLAKRIELPLRVLVHLTDRDSSVTIAMTSKGRALFLLGRFREARQWQRSGLDSSGASFSLWKINSLSSLALLEAWCGHARLAVELATESLDIAREVGLLLHISTADAYLALALAAIEHGDPKGAREPLREAVLRNEAYRRHQQLWLCFVVGSLLSESEGADQAFPKLPLPAPSVVADRLLLQRMRAARLASSRSGESAAPGKRHRENLTHRVNAEDVALALSHNDVKRAEFLLGEFSRMPESAEPYYDVQRLLLSARLADMNCKPTDLERHIRAAMDIADANGLVEVFIRAGRRSVAFVAEATTHIILRDRVLRRAEEFYGSLVEHELVEALTQKEREILHFLPTTMTSQDIADQTFLSINTIKSHMAHIYRKLNVAGRRAAVIRARGLGLI